VEANFLEDAIEKLGYTPGTGRGAMALQAAQKQERKANKIKEDSLNLQAGPEYSERTRTIMAQMDEGDIPIDLIKAIIMDIRNKDKTGDGAVLVFLPGWNVITMCADYLLEDLCQTEFQIVKMHSMVPREDQMQAFNRPPRGQLKVVLATNIAESSITIPDVVYVIDSCRARLKSASIQGGGGLTSALTDVWAGRANLHQRRGRAGRVRAGIAYHLISKARYEALEDATPPEMLRAPMHELILALKNLNMGGAREVLQEVVDPPGHEQVMRALEALVQIGALDEYEEITQLGRAIATLPVAPRVGHAILAACVLKVQDPMCTLAATIDCQDPWMTRDSFGYAPDTAKNFAKATHSDHFALLSAVAQYEEMQAAGATAPDLDRWCVRNNLQGNHMATLVSARHQLLETLQEMNLGPAPGSGLTLHDVSGVRDPRWSLLSGLMCFALAPNFAMHHSARKVVATGEPAQVHRSSVACTRNSYIFPQCGFVFEEKLRTKPWSVSIRSNTNVSPVQWLLFGCLGASYDSAQETVIVDGWLPMKGSFEVAVGLIALRGCLLKLIKMQTADPASAVGPDWDTSVQDLQYVLSQLGTIRGTGGGAKDGTSYKGKPEPRR